MTPADPLAQLHPLRLPEPVSWWPPAPGWWLLAALVFTAITYGLWYLWRRHRARAYRRTACAALAVAEARWRTDQNGNEYVHSVSKLLKAVALRSFPAAEVAALHGEPWRAFLNQTRGVNMPGVLAEGVYRPAVSEVEITELAPQARRWLLQHRSAT